MLVRVLLSSVFFSMLLSATPVGSGSITGIFQDPDPPCLAPSNGGTIDQVQCSGLGSAIFTWGLADPAGAPLNTLSFTGNTFSNVAVGQTFVAGYLYFYNGTSARGTWPNGVELRMVSSSATTSFNNQVMIEPIRIVTVLNTADPVASADFIFFPNHPSLGSFRVLEDRSAVVEILAAFGSLDLVGFGNVVAHPNHPDADPANGYLSASTSIPEPSSLILFATGAGLILSSRRRGTSHEHRARSHGAARPSRALTLPSAHP